MSTTPRHSINANVLWISAIALSALVIVQLGHRLGAGSVEQSALAEMVASVGDYSIMTTDGGNEEMLFVLDNRNEQLMVYKIGQQQSLVLLAREKLSDVFASARNKLGGR